MLMHDSMRQQATTGLLSNMAPMKTEDQAVNFQLKPQASIFKQPQNGADPTEVHDSWRQSKSNEENSGTSN